MKKFIKRLLTVLLLTGISVGWCYLVLYIIEILGGDEITYKSMVYGLIGFLVGLFYQESKKIIK